MSCGTYPQETIRLSPDMFAECKRVMRNGERVELRIGSHTQDFMLTSLDLIGPDHKTGAPPMLFVTIAAVEGKPNVM